jgi:hypothetical protein
MANKAPYICYAHFNRALIVNKNTPFAHAGAILHAYWSALPDKGKLDYLDRIDETLNIN